MSVEFRMPSLGPDMAEGTLVEWRIAPGKAIKRGDVVALVETEKGIIDVEAFHDGIVERLLIEPGAHVPVGEVLALFEGERLKPVAPSTPAARATSKVDTQLTARLDARFDARLDARLDEALEESFPASDSSAVHAIDLQLEPQAPPSAERNVPQPPPPATAPHARIKISPAARLRAHALGVATDALTGSGADGAITLEDVERAATARAKPAARVSAGFRAGVGAAAGAGAPMRHAIAASMTRAKREIPHYYLTHTLDFEPARGWLENFNAARPVEDRLLYSALIIKAVARAAAEVPGFNGYYREQRFQPATETHIGFAVAQRGGGLVAPAILNASSKDPATIMRELKDLVARARTGHLRSSELASPTITITSLGDEGVDAVYPIVFPDQVAIVGVGRLAQRPWVVAGQIAPRTVLIVTLAADHRVSDGRAGAKFLTRIAALLSSPGEL